MALPLLPEFACPQPIADSDRPHEAGAGGERQEVVAKADQAPRGNQVLETDAAPGIVGYLDHLSAALPERLGHGAKMLLADVHGEALYRLHELTIHPLDDGLRAGHFELIALAAHRLDEQGQVELATAADKEELGRSGVLDMQAEVGIKLLVQPRAQLADGRELAIATGEWRGVDAGRHAHGRLVDLDARQRT